MQDEFELLGTINQLFRRWWIILVVAILGGLVGFGISMSLKPIYQAEAIFNASIDFTEINYENLVGEYGDPLVFTQYDEDLAVQIVQRILLSQKDEAYAYAVSLDPELTWKDFLKNYQVQRYHAHWYLRYRHEDPGVAQAIVNYWADESMISLQAAQESGKAEPFVIVDYVSEAVLPQAPTYHNRNTLVLAGTVIGFVIGILLADSRKRFAKPQASEA